MLKAVTRQAAAVDAKIRAINDSNSRSAPPISTANFFDHHATAEDVAVMVTEQDFLDAHRELIPSVSAGELAHYESVRAAFEGGRDKQQQQQQQQPQQQQHNGVDVVVDVGHKNNNKGKGKAVASSTNASTTGSSSTSSKGKGKAVATTAPATASDDDDEEDQYGSYQNPNGRSSTMAMMKGKGGNATGAAGAKFQDGTASDDENLY